MFYIFSKDINHQITYLFLFSFMMEFAKTLRALKTKDFRNIFNLCIFSNKLFSTVTACLGFVV